LPIAVKHEPLPARLRVSADVFSGGQARAHDARTPPRVRGARRGAGWWSTESRRNGAISVIC
jgi:hypothetical protein